MRKGCVAVRNPVKLPRNSAKLLAKLPRNPAKPRETPRNSAKLLAKLPRNCAKLSRNCAWPLRPLSRRPLSPGVSRCRGCRAVSGSVEAGVEAVSVDTGVGVSGSVGLQCRGSVGAVSGLLDSGDVRTVSRCQAVSECRSVGVSGVSERCRGVGVSMPYTDGNILSQSCKFRFLKSNSTFTTTYRIWAAASCCGATPQARIVPIRHRGDELSLFLH